jgi:hypothetical protein
MKRLKLLTALAIGIMASTSGVVQAEAATYSFFVNFNDKEVANFSEFKQSFTEDTFGLTNYINFQWTGDYRYDSCPTNFTTNLFWTLDVRKNNTGAFIQLFALPLPDFVCTTTNTFFEVNLNVELNSTQLDWIVNDDGDFITFLPQIGGFKSVGNANRILYLSDVTNKFELFYDFNTTYLFNYFMSDVKYNGFTSSGGTYSSLGTRETYLRYVFTTAGNDTYIVFNNSLVNIGTTRKKYAIDVNEEFFRGNSVGAGFETTVLGTDEFTFTQTTGSFLLNNSYNFYFLNVANLSQAIVDAPIFDFEEEDCGSFLALNVGCFINNAFAYITNDAPIVSDAFTLLNAGIEMAAQTFGIIGEFADDNVFGVLILAGFGFIAVKWFLKND